MSITPKQFNEFIESLELTTVQNLDALHQAESRYFGHTFTFNEFQTKIQDLTQNLFLPYSEYQVMDLIQKIHKLEGDSPEKAVKIYLHEIARPLAVAEFNKAIKNLDLSPKKFEDDPAIIQDFVLSHSSYEKLCSALQEEYSINFTDTTESRQLGALEKYLLKRSSYFQDLFSKDFKEDHKKEIHFDEVSEKAFGQILEDLKSANEEDYSKDLATLVERVLFCKRHRLPKLAAEYETQLHDFVSSNPENLSLNKILELHHAVYLSLPRMQKLCEEKISAFLATSIQQSCFKETLALLAPHDKEIESLNFRNTSLTKEILKEVALTLPHLQSLSLPIKIRDEDLQEISLFTELISLSLEGCKKITDKALKYLAPLTKLTFLNLARCKNMTGEGLKHLFPLTNLISLDLEFSQWASDFNASHPLFPKLTYLNLSYSHITDEALNFIAGFTKLITLNLTACHLISDNGLSKLASLTCLESLTLVRCNITGVGLAHLNQLPITSLNALACRLTDDCLLTIASFNFLTTLTLGKCAITDRGLSYLSTLKPLAFLNLTLCQQITEKGLNQLPTHVIKTIDDNPSTPTELVCSYQI